jgi:hypothetical protein
MLMAAAILISGILFVYKLYLTKQVASASDSLALVRDTFEKDTIAELELYDKRTQSAKQILSKHVVFSPMFTLLGEITIPSIQYTSFTETSDDKGNTVTIDGLARDYRSIALQADMFNSTKGRSFDNVLFSNLVKDKNNNIGFNLKFTVGPELLSYENNVLSEQGTSSGNNATSTTPLSTDSGNQTQ